MLVFSVIICNKISSGAYSLLVNDRNKEISSAPIYPSLLRSRANQAFLIELNLLPKIYLINLSTLRTYSDARSRRKLFEGASLIEILTDLSESLLEKDVSTD